ncbi:unnamed protein product [Closterium sp. Naga37s-1]|nr:unnamed protein product [Closterium sp. Naga37s-1]
MKAQNQNLQFNLAVFTFCHCISFILFCTHSTPHFADVNRHPFHLLQAPSFFTCPSSWFPSLISLPHLSSLFLFELDFFLHLLQKLDNFPLLRKAIELGRARMKMINNAVVVALRQRAGTDSLNAAMVRAEKRISALERHLEDSRKELEERETTQAELIDLRRQVQEMKDEEQALKREMEQEREERRIDLGEMTYVLARGNAGMERMQMEAGDMVKAVHALKLTVDSVALVVRDCAGKSELVGVHECLAALKGEVAGHKTAAAREMHEVRQTLGGVRERNCEAAGVLAQRGRELVEMKRELAAVRREVFENMSALQREVQEIRDILRAVEERNGCSAASMAERDRELAAVEAQLAAIKQELLPRLKEAARREAIVLSEGQLARAREVFFRQNMAAQAEVDEIRMKFQERTAEFAAVLKQKGKELAAVKQALAEFRKAAEREADGLRSALGALREGNEEAFALVRESEMELAIVKKEMRALRNSQGLMVEGGVESSKQGCASGLNGTAKAGHRKGDGDAIWQVSGNHGGKLGCRRNGKRRDRGWLKEEKGGCGMGVGVEATMEGVAKVRKEKGRGMWKGGRERWDNARVQAHRERPNKKMEAWQEYVAVRDACRKEQQRKQAEEVRKNTEDCLRWTPQAPLLILCLCLPFCHCLALCCPLRHHLFLRRTFLRLLSAAIHFATTCSSAANSSTAHLFSCSLISTPSPPIAAAN